jgi:hypothetical protein
MKERKRRRYGGERGRVGGEHEAADQGEGAVDDLLRGLGVEKGVECAHHLRAHLAPPRQCPAALRRLTVVPSRVKIKINRKNRIKMGGEYVAAGCCTKTVPRRAQHKSKTRVSRMVGDSDGWRPIDHDFSPSRLLSFANSERSELDKFKIE